MPIWAAPLHLKVRGDKVHGTAVFGAAYEGPPGCVHGGFIAASFDEVLGMTQSMTGHPGMTGTLTIRYRRPTPLHAEIRFEAELDRVEGRKIFTVGRSFDPDGQLIVGIERVVWYRLIQSIGAAYIRETFMALLRTPGSASSVRKAGNRTLGRERRPSIPDCS